jgi:hypothetical protein
MPEREAEPASDLDQDPDAHEHIPRREELEPRDR